MYFFNFFNLFNFNIKDMSYMFNKCSSLIYLNLFNFNNNIKAMAYIFNECTSLTSLNLSNFNNNNINKMFVNIFL